MSEYIVLIVLSVIISIFTLAAIGGNDVANSQGTAVGSGALSLRGAQILAGICEFAGAALVGHQVSNTIGSKMVHHESANISDLQYCWGMFAGLLSVGLWMIIATKIKMPVSATHSIVGALFGLNLVLTNFDFNSIDWVVLGKIAIAWIVTPLLSFAASYLSLILLNIYWPSDHDRDQNMDASMPSITPTNRSDISNRSSLISFVMAPASERLTPIPTPSPKRLGQQHKIRLTWAVANANNNEDQAGENDAEDHDNNDYKFEPAPGKFALVFGILMATLVVFIMIGGPKSINIEDGAIEVDDWVIVVISFGSLIFFTVIGYFIEGCYRRQYVKYIYAGNTNTEQEYASVELAQKKRDSQACIVVGIDGDNGARKSVSITPKSSSDYATLNKRTGDVDIYGNTGEIDGTCTEKETEKTVENTCTDKCKQERTPGLDGKDVDDEFNNQDYFRLYLIVASGAVAFAHGGNDVANVLGPFGQIYKYATTGSMEGEQEIPIYVSGGAGIAIAVGFALFGAPVLETIGKSITKLSYRSGFTAQFCAAATVLICNVLGLPVSSSTVIVGGVAGVGFYNSKYKNKKNKKKERENMEEDVEYVGCINKCKYLWQQKNIRILCKILAIWIITIPVNAVVAGSVYAFINVFL